MTLLDSQNIIYSWFSKHEIFEFDTFFKETVNIVENKAQLKAILRAGLDIFVNLGLCKYVTYTEEEKKTKPISGEIWVLEKPFNQTLTISPTTANLLSEELNKFLILTKNENLISSAANLKEMDVVNVVSALSTMNTYLEKGLELKNKEDE